MFVYEDLRESGYTKVKLSDKEYKKYINRSQKPLMGVFYNFYVFYNIEQLKTEVLPNLFNKLLSSLLFPFIGIVYGFNKSTFNDFVLETWKARSGGHYISHNAYNNEKTEDVFEFLKTKKPIVG